jgi:hypothetical protein
VGPGVPQKLLPAKDLAIASSDFVTRLYLYIMTVIFKDTSVLHSDMKTYILAYKHFLIIGLLMCYPKATLIEEQNNH